ncbi:hypothetical protein Tco_0385866 [Tanacetum coccineum]
MHRHVIHHLEGYVSTRIASEIIRKTRLDLDFAVDRNLRELSGEEAWEAIENFAQGQKEWDNPPNTISEQEVANLKAQAKTIVGNENVMGCDA